MSLNGKRGVLILNNSESNPLHITTQDQILSVTTANVRTGQIPKWSSITILAENTMVGTTEKVLFEGASDLSFDMTFPATARILSIASTSANDTSSGTGGRTAFFRGLDANYQSITEQVTLNGQTEVDTTLSFLRVQGISIRTTGSSNTNEGIIYVSDSTDTFTSGEPQNRVYKTIPIGHSLGKSGVYTMAANTTGYHQRMIINTTATAAKPATIRFYRTSKVATGTDGTRFLSSLVYASESLIIDLSNIPGTTTTNDITITAETTTGNISVAVKLETLLFDTS